MKKIKKIINVIERKFIKLWSYFNIDIYMKYYSVYLKKIGINIIGTPKFISPDVYFDGTDYSLISIGNNVTISREVMFLTHDYSINTAFCSIGEIINRHEGELHFRKPIEIGNNTFIGARVSLLPGTSIGNDCIVGSCAVVKGNIPNDSIVVGNPCKIIGSTKEFAQYHKQLQDYMVER